jgi:hypothetical protein
MKLTITNNGTTPFSVTYSDLYKLYDETDGEHEGDTIVLQPDTSVTLDNVETIREIGPIPEEQGLDTDEEDLDLDSLDLDDDSDENDDEEGNLLSQEDFDLNEQEAAK